MTMNVHSDKMKISMFTVVFVLCVRATEGSDITCVAGETAVGCTAIVTCHFGRNIRDNKQTFMIYQYPTGTTNFDIQLRKDVMSCNWKSEQSLNCYVESPYVAHISYLQSVQSIHYIKNTPSTFESQMTSDSSNIRVEITNVTKEHAGIYECQLVSPTEYIPSRKCVLTVSEMSIAGTPGTLCHTSDSNQAGYPAPFISVLAILLLVVVVAGLAIGLLVFLRCRNKSARKGNKRDQQNRVSKCCCRFCERVANVFKLPVAGANIEPVEESLALTETGANTAHVHVQTADVGTHVTEDHFKPRNFNLNTTYVATPHVVPAKPTKPVDLALHLPKSLTKEPRGPLQPNRETTDGGSSAHKKSPLPEGREQEAAAEGLLSQNPQSESREGATWYTDAKRDAYGNIDVKNGKQSG